MQTSRKQPIVALSESSRLLGRWGLQRCRLVDRATFDAGLSSLMVEGEIPSDPEGMADFLQRDAASLRRLLNDAIAMANECQRAFGTDEAWPAGAAEALDAILQDFEAHDAREDIAYRMAARDPAACPGLIDRLLDDHAAARTRLASLRTLTRGYRPPAHADTAWRLFYVVCLKIERALMERMQLEEDQLFLIAFRGEPASGPAPDVS